MERERNTQKDGAWELFLKTGLPEAWLLSRSRAQEKRHNPPD